MEWEWEAEHFWSVWCGGGGGAREEEMGVEVRGIVEADWAEWAWEWRASGFGCKVSVFRVDCVCVEVRRWIGKRRR